MKIVSLCGSKRKNGNTETMLKAFDKEFSAAKLSDYKNKFFDLAEMHIYPCRACLKCKKKGICVIEDDFGKVALKMIQSDLIIMGSPVYFSDVSAYTKALIDRTISLWHNKALKGKNIILVAACAESGTGHTLDTMRHWAIEHGMNIIATVDGKSERKGKVLEDEMTLKAIQDAVRSCDTIIPAKES